MKTLLFLLAVVLVLGVLCYALALILNHFGVITFPPDRLIERNPKKRSRKWR
jgi:hypothetical protein